MSFFKARFSVKVTKLYGILWSSDPSFCYDLFCSVKKVWLTCWNAVYTGIRRLTKCLDNLLKSSVQCKPAAFLFVLIPFVVWRSYSQLSGFAVWKTSEKSFYVNVYFELTEEEIHFPCKDLQLCDGEVQRPIRSINKPLPNYSQGEVFQSLVYRSVQSQSLISLCMQFPLPAVEVCSWSKSWVNFAKIIIILHCLVFSL